MSAPDSSPALERRLGPWDGALLTMGAIVGSGIFLTTSDIARVLPRPALVLLVWVVGGLLTLAGALTYAELGAMYPKAGGMYHFLKEAYGPFWGFLFGWTCFWIIMSGGNAAIATGFGEYLGGFVPFFSASNTLFSIPSPFGGGAFRPNGVQLAAALAIVLLTAINHVGVRSGALVQNVLTVVKIGALAGLVVFGFAASRTAGPTAPDPGAAALPALLSAFGVAMIAALWTFDGWYGLTFSAGEMRRPERDLPAGLIGGVAAVTGLYLLVNGVYVRALSVSEIAATPRVGEAAAAALLGPAGGRLMAAAILVSIFGCLASTILYSSRIYQPMAADGVFFRALGSVHPRFHTPVASLWAQSLWSLVLVFSGGFEALYTYVVFASVVFHAMTGAAVLVLRKTRADAPRPYRAWGYPVVPLLFIASCLLLVGNTLREKPRESLAGVGLVALGAPAYAYWRRRARHAG